MRGKVRKEHILFSGVVVVLFIALGQLGMLIYKTYNSTGETKKHVEISIEQSDKCIFEIYNDKSKLEETDNHYIVPIGKKIRIHCKADEGYGIKQIWINDNLNRGSNVLEEWVDLEVKEDIMLKVDIGKLYTIKVKSIGEGEIKFCDEKEFSKCEKEFQVFEGEKICLKCTAFQKYYIKTIIINGESKEKNNNEENLTREYTYNSKEVNRNYDICITYEKIRYTVEVEENQNIKVQIDNKDIKNAKFDAGSNIKIIFRTCDKNVYITSVNINGEENEVDDSREYTMELHDLAANSKIRVNTEKIETIEDNPSNMFDVYEGDILLRDYRIFIDSNKIKYIFNKNRKVEFTINSAYKEIYRLNSTSLRKKVIEVTNNFLVSKLVLKEKSGSMVRYAYPIQIIFDTTPPETPTYTLSHPSLTQTKLTTTIQDAGDSGIESVQFGTRADYDAKASKDETKERHHTEAINTSGRTYTFTLNQNDLKEDEYCIWATDNAGNRSAATKVDLTGPRVYVETKSDWTNQDVTIKGTVADLESKVAKVCYTTNKDIAEKHFYGQNVDQQVNEASLTKEGTFEIKTTTDKSGVVTYYIWAYDNWGNKSKDIQLLETKVDKHPPVVSLRKKQPDEKWTNKAVSIEFNAIDKEEQGYSGIDRVYYFFDQQTSKEVELQVNKDESQSYTIQTPTDKEGKAIAEQGSYYIYATDKAGNQSEPLKVEVNIDVDAPKPNSLSITGTDNVGIKKTSFGLFYDKAISIKVGAEDSYYKEDTTRTVSSGTKEIALLCDGKEVKRRQVQATNEIADFRVDPESQGEFSIVCYDNAGNISEKIPVHTINTEYPSFICIETERPDIQVNCNMPDYQDSKGSQWYAGHQNIDVMVKDSKSGLGQVQVLVNGEVVEQQSDGKKIAVLATDQKTDFVAFTINTQQNGDSSDGKYIIEIKACDNAGNEKTYEKTIYIDQQEPTITKFTFSGEGIQDSKDTLIEKMEYGYFFNGKTKVTISAADASPSAGIKEIEYYLVDCSKNKEGVESKKEILQTDAAGNASFVINKQFKGKVCARAFDQVNHTTAHYSKPYGMVIDSSAKGSQYSQIEFTTPESKGRDAEGNELYDKDMDVTVDLSNKFKGIRTIEWEVNEEGNEKPKQGGKVEVSSSGQLSGKTSGYQILETDKNLVTHVQGKVHVSGNSNRIRLHVVLTDRSGVQQEKEIFLSIDKTTPQVSISFDKQHTSSYYNENRTATITVKDRNFDQNRITMFLHNTDGAVPKLSAWRRQRDGETYIAMLEFDRDGLYALNLSAEDLAGNKSSTVSAESFTIDKTKPTINVELNQVQEKQGDIRYYNQPVQARISIDENNFSIDKVEVQGKGSHKGKEITYPKVSCIRSTKASHSLELGFQEEGEYTLSLRCTDEAGNCSESTTNYHFIIDKTSPVIQIEGVEDSKAYNGTIIPKIKVTDLNYKEADTKLTLLNGKGEKVSCKPIMTKIEEGFCFTLDCFPKEKEYDQVYQLQIDSRDMAGNAAAKKMYFSVNRFGSTYYFNDALQQASGKYLNKEFDVTITETNVNAINPANSLVRMICNDTVTDLVPERDYTVEPSGGNGSWYTYKYQISKGLMKEDGIYQFALYTKDEAGNINENEDKDKKALVWFGMDRTAPRVVPINVSNGGTYNQTSRRVSVRVEDNLVLNSAKVFVNDDEVEYSQEGDHYTFDIGSSNKAQKIRIVAIDQAGNQTEKTISELYVTTNLIVRIVHGKVLFTVGMIVLCGCLTAVLVGFIVYRKKRARSMMQ